ncbi:MAG: antitoxin Xre/MbcA/ParS toxin-binding domain-containing protein [Betaproteobacteria bacterium]
MIEKGSPRGKARTAGRSHAALEPAPDAVLTKAVVRAASLLGLTQKELAAILGVSEATTSRMFADQYLLAPSRAKEWELARLFVRLFRSLDALWGHGEEARTWLASPNRGLVATRPRDLLTSVEGLVRVVAYLDAARGRV